MRIKQLASFWAVFNAYCFRVGSSDFPDGTKRFCWLHSHNMHSAHTHTTKSNWLWKFWLRFSYLFEINFRSFMNMKPFSVFFIFLLNRIGLWCGCHRRLFHCIDIKISSPFNACESRFERKTTRTEYFLQLNGAHTLKKKKIKPIFVKEIKKKR